MKRYLIAIILLSICACSNPQKKGNEQQSTQEQNSIGSLTNTAVLDKSGKELKFKETNEKAVLIGEKIELLDKNLNTIDDISNLKGKIIDIKGISDSLCNKSKNICDAFWYVKIETKNIVGIVNGRKVFKIQNSNQNTSFLIDSNQMQILTTGFLGMGVEYEGDLLGCPVNQPILMKDIKNNYFGLVALIQNEYSKKANWDNEYPYFELRSDDRCNDRIDSIISENEKIRLKIHRYYQEGENEYEVMLTFDNEKYTAEYLNFGEIRYK